MWDSYTLEIIHISRNIAVFVSGVAIGKVKMVHFKKWKMHGL